MNTSRSPVLTEPCDRSRYAVLCFCGTKNQRQGCLPPVTKFRFKNLLSITGPVDQTQNASFSAVSLLPIFNGHLSLWPCQKSVRLRVGPSHRLHIGPHGGLNFTRALRFSRQGRPFEALPLGRVRVWIHASGKTFTSLQPGPCRTRAGYCVVICLVPCLFVWCIIHTLHTLLPPNPRVTCTRSPDATLCFSLPF